MLFLRETSWNFKPKHVTSGKFFLNNFSCIERILTGPGAHSPPFKSTLEGYRLYTPNNWVFHWCSIKISWCLPFTAVYLKIFWLSIKWHTTDLWICHKYSSFVAFNHGECAPGPIKIHLLREKLLGKNKLGAASNYVCSALKSHVVSPPFLLLVL